MEHPPNTFAVDAGGTQCRMRLIFDGTPYDVTLGSANVSSDFDQSIATLRAGMEQICAMAPIECNELWQVPAYLGMAGLIGEAIRRKTRTALPFRNAIFADDRTTATVGALGDDAGVVLGLGTGSFFARQDKDQALTLVGGWGFTLGDQASGAWLGKNILGKVLETFDGTLPHSDLSQDLSAEFNHDPAAILAFTQHAAPADYGKYAPRLMDAAKSGDSIAQACVREAVSYIERILAHLDPKSSFDLCPIGGLAQSYIPFFPQEMQTRMVQAKSTALDGATLLATRLAKGL